jgi:hypothetical protein
MKLPDYTDTYIPITIIESPYKGNNYIDLERNMEYLRAAIRDCLLRGEAPFASHALYTQPGVLDDTVAEERELGIQAGFTFREVADITAVYTDLGITEGMKLGIENAEKHGGSMIIYRSLPEWAEKATSQQC